MWEANVQLYDLFAADVSRVGHVDRNLFACTVDHDLVAVVSKRSVREPMTKWIFWAHVVLIVPSISEEKLFSVVALKVNSWELELCHLLLVFTVRKSNGKLSARNCDSFNDVEDGLRHLLTSVEIHDLGIDLVGPREQGHARGRNYHNCFLSTLFVHLCEA